MKIVAIVGSPRPEGNTSLLVDEALKAAAEYGVETEKIVLGEYTVGPCLGHDNCSSFAKCKQDDDVPWILEKYCQADGVILGSPVYYYNMTAQMKAFVDRNYFLYRHDITPKATCAGLVVVGGGAGLDQTVRALRRFLKLSFDVPDDRLMTLTGYASKVGEVKNKQPLLEEARKLGRQLAEMLNQK